MKRNFLSAIIKFSKKQEKISPWAEVARKRSFIIASKLITPKITLYPFILLYMIQEKKLKLLKKTFYVLQNKDFVIKILSRSDSKTMHCIFMMYGVT